MSSSIIQFFGDGGPSMFVNLFWLAVALAVALERMVALLFRYNLSAPPFMEEVTKLVMTGNVDRAVKLCDAAPHSPLARVLRAGLARAHRGEREVARALEEALVENTRPVGARISWLGPLAVIATLVGLAGTSFGLGGVPAEGLSKAMNPTAFGLSISALCVTFHLFLSAYAKSLVETVELQALKLENLLARRAAGETPGDDVRAA